LIVKINSVVKKPMEAELFGNERLLIWPKPPRFPLQAPIKIGGFLLQPGLINNGLFLFGGV